MTTKARPRPAVDFATGDHAGFWRRFTATLTDAALLYALWGLMFNVWLASPGASFFNAETLVAAWYGAAFVYLSVLKRSGLRTVGYRLAGVRIVDRRGGPPSVVAMLVRCGLNLLGGGFPLLDFLWLLGRHPRQKLTDEIAGTRVVRSRALPSGEAEPVTVYYMIFGHFLVVPGVRPVATAGGPAASTLGAA